MGIEVQGRENFAFMELKLKDVWAGAIGGLPAPL
jgi:hypothetical protein